MVFYSSRANPISTAHAAEGPSFFCWPKRRKQENGLGIACMSATLPKPDSCSLHTLTVKGAGQLRYGRDSIIPFDGAYCRHLPLAPTPAVPFFLWKPSLLFSFCRSRKNLDERCNRGMTAS